MTRHTLITRTDDEILWFQRRDFLRAAAGWTALGGLPGAQAQARSNVVEWQGDILLNGRRLLPEQSIQSGDQIATGPGSTLVFAVGNTAFKVRQNTQMVVERGNSINAVSILRLFAGAVASVWGRGDLRQISTPTLTAGIRGTGVYTEVWPKDDGRTYFCNCYGNIELVDGPERLLSQAQYHESFWAEVQPRQGRLLTPTEAINHSDEEIEMLARLVGQRTAWQIAGRKGVKNTGDAPANPPAQYGAPQRSGY